jgi:hypothetical protein
VELQFEIPWIIDVMDNTLQKTFGGMPNMEFVIGPDGTLLASWNWANPNELKELLEEKVGPSGISEEEWGELSQRRGRRISLANNDEVPGTQVPHSALSSLKVERISKIGGGNSPFTLSAGTFPPGITPNGQSRLYLTIQPDTDSGLHFDSKEASVVLLTDAKGIQFQKDEVKAGTLRGGEDVYPHTVGANWTQEEGAENMEFIATVVAKMAAGEEPVQEKTVKFRIAGAIPVISRSMDEILITQLPKKNTLKKLKSTLAKSEDVPFDVEAFIQLDRSNPGQGTGYLVLKIDAAGGYKWNNLSDTQVVKMNSVSGVKLEKDTLMAGKRDYEEDTDDRIFTFKLALESGVKQISFEVTPEAWVCHSKQGWCREFVVPFKVTGKL